MTTMINDKEDDDIDNWDESNGKDDGNATNDDIHDNDKPNYNNATNDVKSKA